MRPDKGASFLDPLLADAEPHQTTGFKFVSEKVSHQPVVMAFHAEAPAWQINGHVAPSQKFWGRSMEVRWLSELRGTLLTLMLAQVFVHGDFNVTFADTGDTFSIRKPSSFVCVPLPPLSLIVH